MHFNSGILNLLLIEEPCFPPYYFLWTSCVCAESHLAVIGGSNMRGAHYQLSVGPFASHSSSSTIHFLQGNYGDACCNIFRVKKVFLFYVTYFPLGFITRVIFCLCMYSLWRKISGVLLQSSLVFSYSVISRDCVKQTECSNSLCR